LHFWIQTDSNNFVKFLEIQSIKVGQ
jgi:hypothetical protein